MLRKMLASLGLAAAPKPCDTPPYSPYATDAANSIYNLLFCDDFAAFTAKDGLGSPWQAALASHPADVAALTALATNEKGTDGRIRYLAYQRLRREGGTVPPKRLLGVIYEVGMVEGLDTLAAFSEGSVRYINHSGKMAVIEGVPSFLPYVENLFDVSRPVVAALGPWDKPRRAPPGKGTVRITFLASDGLYFGEGPFAAMAGNAMGGPIIAQATKLLLAVVESANSVRGISPLPPVGKTRSNSMNHRDVPWILEEDVERLLEMKPLVDAVREAFVHLALGQAEVEPRRRVGLGSVRPTDATQSPGKRVAKPRYMLLHAMSAADSVWKLICWKNYVTSRQGAKFVVALYGTDSLLPLAFLEADRLGQMRTGAATGVAVDRLTAPDLDAMALWGTGWQAEGQLAGALAVRPIRRVDVYGRDDERLRDFCQRMSAKHEIDVRPADYPDDAAKDKRLIVSATSAETPIVPADKLPEAGLFVAMGSNWPHKQEFDSDFVNSCSAVVVDHREACRLEAGELIYAERTGKFDWSRAVELGDLLVPSETAGDRQRSSTLPAVPTGRVLFKSVGLAIEDLAGAKLVVEAASGD